MGMSWIREVMRPENAAVFVDPSRFPLPCFAGLRVCATGLERDERERVARRVVANGGSFDNDLNRNNTHLIVSPAGVGVRRRSCWVGFCVPVSADGRLSRPGWL